MKKYQNVLAVVLGLLLWAALGLLAEKPPKAGPAFTTPLHKPGKV